MMPSGNSTPVAGGQSAIPSLLRTNSMLSNHSGLVPIQPPFHSLISPQNHFSNNTSNMNLLGNMSNASSFLNNSFGSSHMDLQHRSGGGGIDMVGSATEPDRLSSSGQIHQTQQQFANPTANEMSSDHLHVQQVDSTQNYQQQFSIPNIQTQQLRGGLGHSTSVKIEAQMCSSDQNAPQHQLPLSGSQQQQNLASLGSQQQHLVSLGSQQQQLASLGSQQQHLVSLGSSQQQQLASLGSSQHQQLVSLGSSQQQQLASLGSSQQQQLGSLRTLGSVKLEPQQLQSARGLGSVKLEPHQHSDPSLFLQHQQQKQHMLQLSRQSSQTTAQMNLLQQQHRILHLQQQQQQQQQLLKTLPQQRVHLQQQQQQRQQGMPLRGQVKPFAYEPGTCARRLTHYMYHQQHRPANNNIEFWRKFVSEYFAPRAKKRWCVSLYGSGRQTSGVFPQDVWHCEICNRKPGRGFETTVEVLPRLCKIKYDSGTLEELLYVDMPREYQNASGQIVLDYAKAIQESVFEQLRVVRDGQLRIVFNSDLKICSWEFCARRHEELIPRRLVVPQVSQLGAVAQKYQAGTQNATSTVGFSSQELQNTCNSFVAFAHQLAKSLEVPLVNDLGYTKRYVRCLQISEVVNSMKDLIDYSRETSTGPMESLINFPRASGSSGVHSQVTQQSEEQHTRPQISNQNEASTSNGIISANNNCNLTSSTTCANTIAGLLHQNSMNSRRENPISSSSYGVPIQIPSASSSSAFSQPQPNGPTPSSPFPSPTLSASNNNSTTTVTQANHLNAATSPANISTMQQQLAAASQSNEADDPQSSVQQIIQEMMMSSSLSSQLNDMKGINGMVNNNNNNSGMNNMGYGIRTSVMNNNSTGLTTMNQQQQLQQNFGNRVLSNGLGRMNSFNNNLNFDWKTTP